PSSDRPSAGHLLPPGEKGRARPARDPLGVKRTGTAVERARTLHREMTDAERAPWYTLRSRRFSGFKFRRQVPVGPYIAGFLCFDRRLVVECDGSQHAGNQRDARRDAWFAENGFRTLRFWNHEVLRDRRVVADTIFAALTVGS
ncbi:MAG: endonuclease domain-containing protein, partial [Alsobacter sp.]